MPAFEKFARPYFQTETRLCFRVRVDGSNGQIRFYVVRFSYLIRFLREVMKTMFGSQVVIMEMMHYELPVTSFFVEELPF